MEPGGDELLWMQGAVTPSGVNWDYVDGDPVVSLVPRSTTGYNLASLPACGKRAWKAHGSGLGI